MYSGLFGGFMIGFLAFVGAVVIYILAIIGLGTLIESIDWED